MKPSFFQPQRLSLRGRLRLLFLILVLVSVLVLLTVLRNEHHMLQTFTHRYYLSVHASDNLNFVYDYIQNQTILQRDDDDETTNENNNTTTTQLWLYPYYFHEGFSGWKLGLADVMQLAKQLDAVIVIPDILDGALRMPGSGNLDLFEFFNKSHVDSYYSKWVTADDFRRQTTTRTNETKTTKVLHWNIGRTIKPKTGPPRQQRDYQNQFIQPLREALNLIIKPNKTTYSYDNVVLNMTWIWKRQLHNVQLRDKNQKPHPLVSQKESESVIVKKHFVFSDWIHDLADQTLALMNISTHNFGLVHWRADKENLDYRQCAEHLVRARQALIDSKLTKSVHEDTPFILMSSLKVDMNLMWSSMKRKVDQGLAASPAEALQFLTNSNRPSNNRTGSQSGYFLMAESVLPRQKDQIVYVAIDILLVQRATVFATCTRSCSNDGKHRKYAPFADVCNACNWLGNFATSAVRMRQELSAARNSNTDARTLTCWPHSASDVKVLSV